MNLPDLATEFENPVAPPTQAGDPTWSIALLFPRQGHWTEESYLALDTNHLVELVDGNFVVLPTPTLLHQGISRSLFLAFNAFVVANVAGEVFFAPLRIRLFPGHIREPDIVYLRPERIIDRRTPPRGADLLMEIVSEGKENRQRDYEEKREAYRSAGVSEYWIVDPQTRCITVLRLDGNAYHVHGEFAPGQKATSAMFPKFQVDVSEVFAAGKGRSAQ